MTSSEPYTGSDQLHVGDGKGLVISHIAHSKLYTPKHIFLPYQMFCMSHILKNRYCLFRNFALRIMYFLNFIHLCFMLRI